MMSQHNEVLKAMKAAALMKALLNRLMESRWRKSVNAWPSSKIWPVLGYQNVVRIGHLPNFPMPTNLE